MKRQPCWVWPLDQPYSESMAETVDALGGKGASLQRMTRMGLRVPPGFVLTTNVGRSYKQGSRQLPDEVWNQVREQVVQLQQVTGRTFGQGPRPLLLAVRSGAAVSMPGTMVTLLNCGLQPDLVPALPNPERWADRCARLIADYAAVVHQKTLRFDPPLDRLPPTERGDHASRCYELQLGGPFPRDPWTVLRDAIIGVLESWYGPTAHQYRRLYAIADDAGTAVTIQEMVDADVAGVMFTRDPRDVRQDQLMIEAVEGLGDRLVSGQINPSQFRLSRDDLKVVSDATAEQGFLDVVPASTVVATLDHSRLQQLAQIGLRLEDEYQRAMDVEWAFAEGQFHLLQARPLPTSEGMLSADQLRGDELTRLRRLAQDRSVTWVRHSLSESIAAPTPFTWSILSQFMSGQGGFGGLYRLLGFSPSSEVSREGFLQLVFGRIYADSGRVAGLFCGDLPLRYDLQRLQRDPDLLERAPTQFDPNLTDSGFLWRLPRILWTFGRAAWRIRRLSKSAAVTLQQQVVPSYLRFISEQRSIRLAEIDDNRLIEVLHQRRVEVLNHFSPQLMLPGVLGGLAFARFQDRLEGMVGRDIALPMARALIGGLELPAEVDLQTGLQRLGTRELDWEEFAEAFGHRGQREMELAEPRWHEDRPSLEQLVAGLLSASRWQDQHLEGRRRQAEAERQLPQLLADHGVRSLLPRLQRDLDRARQLLPYREIAKHYWLMGWQLIRDVIVAWAVRHDFLDEVYFLDLEELEKLPAEPERWRLAAARNRQRWQTLKQLPLPTVVSSDHLASLIESRRHEATTRFPASSLSAGSASGLVRRESDPPEKGPASDGFVLVCDAIDVGLLPLLFKAGGVIVRQGGVLSHGALVARQLGLPAVACPAACDVLRSGTQVTVDADRQCVIVEDAGP